MLGIFNFNAYHYKKRITIMADKIIYRSDEFNIQMKSTWKNAFQILIMSIIFGMIFAHFILGTSFSIIALIICIIIFTIIIVLFYLLWLESAALKVPFEIRESGFIYPMKTFKQYRKGEKVFIKFIEISNIIIREGPEMKGWDSIIIKKDNDPEEYYFIKVMIKGGYDILKRQLQEKSQKQWENRLIEKFDKN